MIFYNRMSRDAKKGRQKGRGEGRAMAREPLTRTRPLVNWCIQVRFTSRPAGAGPQQRCLLGGHPSHHPSHPSHPSHLSHPSHPSPQTRCTSSCKASMSAISPSTCRLCEAVTSRDEPCKAVHTVQGCKSMPSGVTSSSRAKHAKEIQNRADM